MLTIAFCHRFDGVRLLQHHNSFSLFTYFIEGLFVFFTFFFTVKELRLMIKEKKHYFDSYWSYAEVAVIIGCYVAIILYVMR